MELLKIVTFVANNEKISSANLNGRIVVALSSADLSLSLSIFEWNNVVEVVGGNL